MALVRRGQKQATDPFLSLAAAVILYTALRQTSNREAETVAQSGRSSNPGVE
jgi:hypothetical protein